MKRIAFLLSLLLIGVFFSCNQRPKKIESSPVRDYDSLTYRVFPVKGGWGYDVIINGKVYIHQPYIPAVQGGFPFRTKEDARKTAVLVIEKLMTKKGLPRVTVKELQELGVLYDTVVKYQEYMQKYLHSRPGK